MSGKRPWWQEAPEAEPVRPNRTLAPTTRKPPAQMTDKERAEQRAIQAELHTLAQEFAERLRMDRGKDARKAVRLKRPCAECLHYVEGCCGARPMVGADVERYPRQYKRLRGRVYAVVSGEGCADDFEPKG